MKTDTHSRYIQTTHLFNATTVQCFPQDTQIRLFSDEEGETLWSQVRKRNVFARHSRENNFYLQRIRYLANKTVIETLRPGDPDDMMHEAQVAAEWAEKIALVSLALVIDRKKLHRRLGMDVLRMSEMDITIGRGFQYLRSKSRRRRGKQGLDLDETFAKRFNRCGFAELYSACIGSDGLSRWMQTVVGWVYESRRRCLSAS